jgi:hypothetical protein
MLWLVRWLFTLFLFAVTLWFATTVPLGKRTLWGHLSAIFASKEAHELAEGTREEAAKVAAKLRELGHDAGAGPSSATSAAEHPRSGAPLDPVDERDRRGLDHLVRDKTRHGPRKPERARP